MRFCRPGNTVRFFGAALSACALLHAGPARAADPLFMFVLGFAKNLIESATQSPQRRPSVEASLPLPVAKAPAAMDETDLRALVDESFIYLTSAQRAELLAGLDKALSDPANTVYREVILTQFVNVARQVQFTHSQLSRLTAEEKRAVAERFSANYRTLGPAQQQALIEQLRMRALPLPADLNEMMLTALAGPL